MIEIRFRRMLKKTTFSPSQPWRLLHPPALSLPRQPLRPGTRLVPSKAAGESKPEEVQTALRVGRSPLQMDLGKRISSSTVCRFGEALCNVEDFDEPRTTREKERVSARRGWAGEESGFFSILLSLPP